MTSNIFNLVPQHTTRLRDKRDRHGFTLVELLVVVVILVALAAIAVPIFLNQATKAKDASAVTTAATAASVLADARALAQAASYDDALNHLETSGETGDIDIDLPPGSVVVNSVSNAAATVPQNDWCVGVVNSGSTDWAVATPSTFRPVLVDAADVCGAGGGGGPVSGTRDTETCDIDGWVAGNGGEAAVGFVAPNLTGNGQSALVCVWNTGTSEWDVQEITSGLAGNNIGSIPADFQQTVADSLGVPRTDVLFPAMWLETGMDGYYTYDGSMTSAGQITTGSDVYLTHPWLWVLP